MLAPPTTLPGCDACGHERASGLMDDEAVQTWAMVFAAAGTVGAVVIALYRDAPGAVGHVSISVLRLAQVIRSS